MPTVPPSSGQRPADLLSLWLAQGLGIGRIPWAPGTFGSVLGIGWFGILLASGSWVVIGLGTVLGAAVSVWACGEAEKILGKKDPGSVVLDEIIALPPCFVGWLVFSAEASGPLPSAAQFFTNHYVGIIAIFAAFRFFDIAKPWPVRQSQDLPGGWGVTVDDLLASVYVNLATVGFLLAQRLFTA